MLGMQLDFGDRQSAQRADTLQNRIYEPQHSG